LVDLNYNFECDWLIELCDNKLSDNNLASELAENRGFLNQSQYIEEIVIFMINQFICSPMTRQFFDTSIVASSDKEWL